MPYKNREERLKYLKEYYRKNEFTIKQKDKVRHKIYYKNNRDYFLKKYREWRKANPEQCRLHSYLQYRRNQSYYINYRLTHKKESRKFYLKNKDKYNLNRRLEYAKHKKEYSLRELINKKYHVWFNIKDIISEYDYFKNYYKNGI